MRVYVGVGVGGWVLRYMCPLPCYIVFITTMDTTIYVNLNNVSIKCETFSDYKVNVYGNNKSIT